MTETYWPASSSTTPRYAGPVSFFRLPTLANPQDADIALLGLPYDGGTTNRAGTRHGPREIRNQSSLMRRVNHQTRVCPYELARVAAIEGSNAPALKVDDVVLRVDPRYFRPTEVETLLGDPSKAKAKLGWEAKVLPPELAKIMVDADIARLEGAKEGQF